SPPHRAAERDIRPQAQRTRDYGRFGKLALPPPDRVSARQRSLHAPRRRERSEHEGDDRRSCLGRVPIDGCRELQILQGQRLPRVVSSWQNLPFGSGLAEMIGRQPFRRNKDGQGSRFGTSFLAAAESRKDGRMEGWKDGRWARYRY